MADFNLYVLQAAVHAALTADTALMAMVSGVYDHVPAKTDYPYITVGNMRASDMSAQGVPLLRVELVLNVYSRAQGRKEASDILGEVHRLLQDAAMPVEGCALIAMRYIMSEILQERDGLTYQGRMRFEAVLQQESVV